MRPLKMLHSGPCSPGRCGHRLRRTRRWSEAQLVAREDLESASASAADSISSAAEATGDALGCVSARDCIEVVTAAE